MASYRVQLEILGLRPGHAPEEVMDSAVQRVAESHHVDERDIDIAAGTARILLRFSVPPDADEREIAEARQTCLDMQDAVEAVAHTGRMWLLRRVGGRWLPISLAH